MTDSLFVAEEVSGAEIQLHKVTRSEMGSYMCIATNGVPPAVAKTVQLNVNCKPSQPAIRSSPLIFAISVQPQMAAPLQLIGAKRRSQQSLQCLAEASPKPINYWTFGTGEMIVANEKFIVQVNFQHFLLYISY